MSTEAQKRAVKKYHEKNKEYYNNYAKLYQRKQRNKLLTYKDKLDRIEKYTMRMSDQKELKELCDNILNIIKEMEEI